MKKIIIFAGTSEGRKLVEYLSGEGVSLTVCVATEYGEQLLPEAKDIKVSKERMNAAEMEAFFSGYPYDLVIDATHPFAVEVSKNIRQAAEKTKLEYLRLLRETYHAGEENGCVVYLESMAAAAAYLNETEGNVLLTIGSKELKQFTGVKRAKERLYARVLSLPSVVQECAALGFEGRNLICMQGPFSEEMNVAMLRQYQAKYLVTKESGTAGGVLEKLKAAGKLGVTSLIIGRPTEETGLAYRELLILLCKRYGIRKKQKMSLIGIGMGNPDQLTIEAKKAIEECEVIFGASRMLDGFDTKGKVMVSTYRREGILDYMNEHPEVTRFGSVFSGDIGFYSGAKSLRDSLQGCEIACYNGISSPIYFVGRLGIEWNDLTLVSLHGQMDCFEDKVKKSKKTFMLLGSNFPAVEVCKALIQAGLSDVTVHLGERLSYPDEKISHGQPADFLDRVVAPLSVMLIENFKASMENPQFGIPDEAFVRAKVPMTKSEIRALCIAKLRLQTDSLAYDIGAGTGSITVEMALQANRGQVFAIEKNPEAVALIHENLNHFGIRNTKVVEGSAPDALKDLPIPTHAFIGGSSGNLSEIVSFLLSKNANVRIVLTAIALETVGEALEVLKTMPVCEVDLAMISVAKGKPVGSYQMMMGQNPIYLISFTGNESKGVKLR